MKGRRVGDGERDDVNDNDDGIATKASSFLSVLAVAVAGSENSGTDHVYIWNSNSLTLSQRSTCCTDSDVSSLKGPLPFFSTRRLTGENIYNSVDDIK